MLDAFFMAMILAASSWIFWLLFVPTIILAIACVEDGRRGPLPWFCIPSVALILFYSYPVFVSGDLLTTLENLALFLLGYAVVGTLYSVVRWYCYLVKWRNNTDISALKTRYMAAIHDLKRMNPNNSYDHLLEFNLANLEWVIDQSGYTSWQLDKFPRVSSNKLRITTWISCWPWSILSWLVRDMISDVSLWIYRRMGFLYNAITKAVLKNFIK